MGSSFSVTAASSTVTLDRDGTAHVVFEVRNEAIVAKRARFSCMPLPPTRTAWLTILATPEIRLSPGDVVPVTVLVATPRDSAPGSYRFRLDAFDPDQRDEEWAHGPVVTIEIAPPPASSGVTVESGASGSNVDAPHDPESPMDQPTAAPVVEPPPTPVAVPAAGAGASGPDTICPDCGATNPSDRRFCGTCGMTLRAATFEIPTAAPPPPPPPPARGPGGFLGGVLGALRRERREPPLPTASRPTRPVSAPADIQIERHTSATFPGEVEAGATARLAFSIGEVLSGGVQGTIAIEAPSGVTSVELVATVHAPDFEIVSPTPPPGGEAPIVVLPLNVVDPSWAVRGEFVLRAKPTRKRSDATILLDFWYRASPVGQIRIETRVVPRGRAKAQPGKRPSGGDFRVSSSAPPPADITLFITDEGGGRYVIQATTPNVFMRDLGAFPAGKNAWAYSETMLDRFRDAAGLPEASRVDRVIGLGLDLWHNLPPAFHDFYWAELHGQDRSIAIYSQEPYIPWELIRPPAEDGRSAGFLGSDFRVARWRNGRLFPDPLAVRDFVVIAPEYADDPLVETAVEAADLVSRFGARVVDGAYDPVAASLRSSEIQLIHFAGHGAYDENAPLQSLIRLSDQGLLPTDVRTFRQGLGRGPFVFLNACEVGEQGWVFTGIGGWADTFCDVGSAGFVGPYWAVDDQVARLAAVRFYDGLAAGRTVGEAIRDVRRAFDEPGPFVHHPTWLAYSLHCQPNIRIDLAH